MYLIDGHNLIGTGLIPGVHLDQEDDEQRLVVYLRARQDRLRQPVLVVFDGGMPGGFAPELSGGGVSVVFAASYRGDADAIILARAQKAPRDTVVVTNDDALRRACRAAGAQVIDAAAFVRRLKRPLRLSTSPANAKENPKLSAEEIEEWLQLFRKKP
jgi:predicted RNA-binding protein with PIN domain